MMAAGQADAARQVWTHGVRKGTDRGNVFILDSI